MKKCVINNGADQPAILSSLISMMIDGMMINNGEDQPAILSSLINIILDGICLL